MSARALVEVRTGSDLHAVLNGTTWPTSPEHCMQTAAFSMQNAAVDLSHLNLEHCS